MLSSKYSQAQVTLFTDFFKTTQDFTKVKTGQCVWDMGSIASPNLIHNINLVHINRELNQETDMHAGP